MQRIDDNTIALTNEELENIREFIDRSLDSSWDHYTDTYICKESWEDGKRRMNPEMYDLAQKMLMI